MSSALVGCAVEKFKVRHHPTVRQRARSKVLLLTQRRLRVQETRVGSIVGAAVARNDSRTRCYHFATQLGSTGQDGMRRKSPSPLI
jgi:hypothetical protein